MRSVMEQHEREFFICSIRLGVVNIGDDVVVRPTTLEQELEANQVYKKSYDESLVEDIMTLDEMYDWMYENEMWDEYDEADIKTLERKIEDARLNVYDSRKDRRALAISKHNLKKTLEQLAEKYDKKNQYYHTTCEGVATAAKSSWIIANTTYKGNELYDFDKYSEEYVASCFYKSILDEHKIRDLVLHEPWTSLWNIKDNSKTDLFKNTDKYELTFNQKNILTWSQLYDNLAESAEPPPNSVIQDHDVLDGWFIVQNKKRKKEQAEQELENSTRSEKIKNASEVFVMAKNKEDIENIDAMNDVQGKHIKKQRSDLIKSKGKVEQHEFFDERVDQTNRQINMFKDKFRS